MRSFLDLPPVATIPVEPAGLALDRRGRLFVADCRNQRVQIVTGTGRFVSSFGEGWLRDPTFVAVKRSGQAYVSDYRKVVRFSPTGSAGTPPDEEGREPPARLACVSQAEGADSEGAG